MNETDKVVEEFRKLVFETDWQIMLGDELIEVNPEDWLRKKLTQAKEEECRRIVEMVEGMKRPEVCDELEETGTCGHFHADDTAYNQALQGIINNLKEE